VWLYRSRIEVRHLKTMRRIPLLWDRWKLAPGWTARLRLEALLRAAWQGSRIYLDLKGTTPGLPAAAMAMMRELAPGRPYAVSSPNWGFLEPFSDARDAEVRVIYTAGDQQMLRGVTGPLRDHPGSSVAVHRALVNPASVERLREVADTVFCWTLNDEATLRHALDCGVRGVISDNLALLRGLLERREAERA
jgi:glycerophosphoryl diester phosphodiesterase